MKDIRVNIDISVQHAAWGEISDLQGHAEAAVKAVLSALDLEDTPLDISLVFAGDEMLQRLNHQYRGKDKPTNVLSFPNEDDIPLEARTLGDVILAFETIAAEAKDQGKTMIDHTVHLLVHGTLHLLGYDHEQDDQAQIMESLEIEILHGLDIENPYLSPLSHPDESQDLTDSAQDPDCHQDAGRCGT